MYFFISLHNFILTASYGSLARFKDIQRLAGVGKYTVIGAGGDMSDFQYVLRMLDELLIEEDITKDDGHELGPAEIHEYLRQVMYARRSKFDPLWNALVVGGFKDGQRYVVLLLIVYSRLLTCYAMCFADSLRTWIYLV